MKPNAGFLPRLSDEEHQALALPSTFLAILVDTLIFLQGFNPDIEPAWRWLYLITGTIGLVYILLQFLVLLPYLRRKPWVHWAISIVDGIGTAILPALIPFPQVAISTILVVAVVVVSATFSGRWPTYLFVCVNIATTFVLASVPYEWLEVQVVHIINLVLLSILITETIQRLGKMINTQMERLETINKIAHRMASTIEPNQVISLINAALQDTVPADSYFLGLLRGSKLYLEVFYDDGEYFPPTEISLDGSLSGWVVKNKQSLLLRDIPVESKKLGLTFQNVGKPKDSLSWMGTLLESGGVVLGVMAIASYQRSAFSTSDLELLESVAQQAALVIDNAYHHAEVEQQSHMDSLTQIYNHGHILVQLDKLTKYAQAADTPLSLIMLDIDGFKQYNDTYGHQVGDNVLVQVVAALRESVRGSDLLGRWGGEEFTILLPETNGLFAVQIADRIRQKLQKVRISDLNGEVVPAPKVSQGIAVFPYEAEDTDALVHLADQRLYQAKERGTHQIEPDPAVWIR